MSDVAVVEGLEDFIERELNLGQKDPHVIYDKLKKQLGAERLATLALPYVPDLIAEMARQKLNQQRRMAIARINERTLEQDEVQLKSLWVPSDEGIVYKRIADMTAEDFTDRADYLDRMVVGIRRHSQWCREVATAIKRNKVSTAGELKRLPGLAELE